MRRILTNPWVYCAFVLLGPQAPDIYRLVRAGYRYSVPPITLFYQEETIWRNEDLPESWATKRVIAYRADGAYADIRTDLQDNPIQRTLRFPDGTQVSIDDRSREKTTTKAGFRPWRDREHFDPTGDCLSNLLGDNRGFRKTGVGMQAGLRGVQVEDSDFGLVVWRSRDLGCVEISSRQTISTITKIRELERFVRRGPDDHLFWVPSGYREVASTASFSEMAWRVHESTKRLDALTSRPR